MQEAPQTGVAPVNAEGRDTETPKGARREATGHTVATGYSDPWRGC